MVHIYALALFAKDLMRESMEGKLLIFMRGRIIIDVNKNYYVLRRTSDAYLVPQ